MSNDSGDTPMTDSDARHATIPDTDWAPYMHWAKTHHRPKWDLSGSNLLPCTIDELPGAAEVLELTGDNDNGYQPLVEAIAAQYGTTPDRVATAGGTSGANFLTYAALLRPGDEVLIERPAYDPLLGSPRVVGATVTRFERRFEDVYRLDPDAIRAAITPRTRLIVITSPHNPSGVVASEDELQAVGGVAEAAGARVLVDEVYLDSVYSDRPPMAASLSDTFISTSSLTKSYGLAGLRAGWVIAAPEVAEAVRRARDVIDAVGSYPSDRLATLAFQQLDRFTARARSILEPNLATLLEFTRSRTELEWIPPSGGTVGFPRISGIDDAGPFVDKMLHKYETGLVPGRFFQSPAHFRVAFGGPADILAGGLEALGRALDRL
jgi:aspartate/methionine/tyrosine aminotransferase